jgi:protease-4
MQPPSPPAAPHDSSDPPPNVFLELVREVRLQREAFAEGQRLVAAERRSERRWRVAFKALVFGVPALLGIAYLLLFLSSTGFHWGPFGDVVGVARIEGAIAPNEQASADSIVPLLKKAFDDAKVKAVVLSIDSGGGAPVEAERIYTALASLKAKHHKPVVAVINNIGASAAYMIALHADKIIAGKYSLVGSIGAIMEPWQLGKAFLEEVKAFRGARLKPDVDVATGEVWQAPEAQQLGLVDAIGTLDEYVGTKFGLRTYDFGPTPPGLSALGRTFPDAVVASVQRLATPVPALR